MSKIDEDLVPINPKTCFLYKYDHNLELTTWAKDVSDPDPHRHSCFLHTLFPAFKIICTRGCINVLIYILFSSSV